VAIFLDWNIGNYSGRGEFDEIDAWESFPQVELFSFLLSSICAEVSQVVRSQLMNVPKYSFNSNFTAFAVNFCVILV
jgi:hypothetical protein